MSVSVTVHQPGSQKGFQRVARGNAKIGHRSSSRSEVDQKCTQENSGPQPVAPQEQSGQRNAGRGPDGRNARVEEGQQQTQFARTKINSREDQNTGQSLQMWFHL